MLAPGIRVVRGPNWIWQNQDGGEGHVGTLCEVGRSGSTHSPEKTVVVNWDSGHRTNYRVGYQKQYDLIVVDNAQIGVKHPNIICDGCTKPGIAGIRFRCADCSNYDLCATCYGNDVHDLEHSFIRYQTANSVGVCVPPRKEAIKIQLRGIFVGARVVRGPDWEWNNQDGGPNKTGRVMEIRGWDNESCRSVANVSWASGSTNVYRLGHKGNVDLRYVQPAFGGYYYKDHMPVLGQPEEQQPVSPPVRSHFNVGDRVQVAIPEERLMALQQGHGGWNPRMAEYLAKIGIVHRITDKGDIRVQYEGCANRWTFHPAALIRIYSFNVGDIVTFITDAAKMQQLQKGHGEWVETMHNVLGKSGKVIKIYGDGDLRVQQCDDDLAWTVNPKCVKLERSLISQATATERSNSMMDLSNQRTNEHHMTPLSGLSGTSAADRLVREAAQGNMDFVQNYLSANLEEVDCVSGGKTCLQVAAHQGHVELVKHLLSLGANVNVVDKEGDSTLHYAAFGNQPDVMRILLQHNASIDVLNSSHCSALHISAHKKPPYCVKVLLEFGANVNVQDAYGDTALHDAIGKENTEVVELLCNCSTLDLTIRNKRGFNALHHASLKGNIHAARHIIRLARQLVNVRKDDGFSALHLAALNGHSKVVEVLVNEGQADINIRNNRRQTPFLLAVSQGHTAAIEKLVELKCNIAAKDEDGDNAMHLCIIKKANLLQEVSASDSPKIFEMYKSLAPLVTENRLMYALLCFLAKEGCPVDINYKGARVLDWIPSQQIKDIIIGYERSRIAREKAATSGPPATDRSLNNSREEEDEIPVSQVQTNLEAMSLAGNNLDESEGNNLQPDGAASPGTSGMGLSNPPTPARRNRGHNRDAAIATPPPVPSHTPNVVAKDDDSKRMNIEAAVTSEPQLSGPSAPLDSPARFQSPNRALSPPATGTPDSGGSSTKHISRRQYSDKNSTASPVTVPSSSPPVVSSIPQECIVCNEQLLLIVFEPCQHQISCEECGLRMKKCLSCGLYIERRLTIGGKQLFNPKDTRLPSADRLRYLESKIMEIEETHCCSICMERRRNVAFLCGHGACSKCAETLKICHMCRKTITKKINLY
ncbi:E3 ubiquitin-protein ligase MIB2 [Topomyia yanbarensis]|uniref:E3 ubiquitin-protein ligase MIB2 n=1 Tax=Topomyia yanbarensis TaxID=2498891 RepID=UPI00273CC561|nr:E3 ubiquitin-protein ligase MIB2 [Topomyia yanbarensis]XP_058819167.1 E3 ubiquitin-protein ligase MIB2 [Topomyia yanbarensis]